MSSPLLVKMPDFPVCVTFPLPAEQAWDTPFIREHQREGPFRGSFTDTGGLPHHSAGALLPSGSPGFSLQEFRVNCWCCGHVRRSPGPLQGLPPLWLHSWLRRVEASSSSSVHVSTFGVVHHFFKCFFCMNLFFCSVTAFQPFRQFP